jgi:putative flippase GtrA
MKFTYKNSLFGGKSTDLVVKHMAVSVTCATIDLSGFSFAYYYIKLDITSSYIVAFLLATAIGYIGHSFFTFRLDKLYLKNLYFFIVQASLSLAIGLFIFRLLVEMDIPVLLSKLMQLGITFSFNILVGKFITFKKR